MRRIWWMLVAMGVAGCDSSNGMNGVGNGGPSGGDTTMSSGVCAGTVSLGTSWSESEACAGNWTRRGSTSTFDAAWSCASGKVTAVLTISVDQATVHITRTSSSDGNDCSYSGTVASDCTSVSGTYTCKGGGGSWTATIDGASNGGGNSSSNGGGATLPNGCEQGYPILCANNRCCPSQYPVCGGSCGYECCASGASTGGGNNPGSCPSGCAQGEVCVNLSGNGVCSQSCTSNDQCGSGCCGQLQGTSQRACLPANNCSTGGGGGGGCQSGNHCISSYPGTGVCEGYIGLTNNCGKQVSCHFVLDNGHTGCALPTPGKNDCAITADGSSGQIVCEMSDAQECVNAIGCNL